MIDRIVDNEKCCGCELCMNICPHNAISMIPDKEGFLQPVVMKDKCVNCSLCIKTCPVLDSKIVKDYYQKDYYGYVAEDEICKRSTSGGIAHALYNITLINGGVIYGVGYEEELKGTEYRRVSSVDSSKLLGTKYSQAKKGDVYKKVKSDLTNKRHVLFIGCPCEVAALKKYLQRDYDLLVTVQLVCMGVTSPYLLKGLLNEMGDSKLKVKNVRERYTHKNWSIPFIKVDYLNGRSKLKAFDPSYYAYAFGKFGRKSCYNCVFKGMERVADLTIGDFWGAEKYVKKINKPGMSVISVHSKKGQELLDLLKNEVKLFEFYEKYDWELLNPYVYKSRTDIDGRNRFSFNFINENYNLNKSARKTMNFAEKCKWRIARLIPNCIWNVLFEMSHK